MSWLELKLRSTRTEAEALETLLWEAGAVSVTITDAEDEPLFEPGVGETPLWHDLVLTGLFEGATDATLLQGALHTAWAPQTLPTINTSILPEQDWVRSWLDDFKPMRFGKHLWVCPSWWLHDESSATEESWAPSMADALAWSELHQELLDAMQQSDQTVMKLDPGLAFGTGTHPTTSLCLQWLDAQDLEGLRLIDFGCGSGILGIAALLLNAAEVCGIDNDPQALTATADNCRKNQIAPERFPVYLPDAFAQHRQTEKIPAADGVIANILAGTLIELAPYLATLVHPSGWIVLSGILSEQSAAVIQAFTAWFADFDVATEGDWVRISAKRLQSDQVRT